MIEIDMYALPLLFSFLSFFFNCYLGFLKQCHQTKDSGIGGENEGEVKGSSFIDFIFSTRSRNENDRYVHLVPELTELTGISHSPSLSPSSLSYLSHLFTGFTEELKEGAEIYKRLVPPAWKKLKFDRNLKKFEDKIGIKWENKELIAQVRR